MSQSLSAATGKPPTANEELAAQIVSALRADQFISASDEAAAAVLLTTGGAKAGDWYRLLEKNLSAPSTSTDTDHAATHYTS